MKLFDLLERAQKNDNEATLEIINRFRPKINKSLYQTHFQNRDDLEQELMIKFIEVLKGSPWVADTKNSGQL